MKINAGTLNKQQTAISIPSWFQTDRDERRVGDGEGQEKDKDNLKLTKPGEKSMGKDYGQRKGKEDGWRIRQRGTKEDGRRREGGG